MLGWVIGRRAYLQGGKVHSKGQAHRKEGEEPGRQSYGGEGDNPVKETGDDMGEEEEETPSGVRHGGQTGGGRISRNRTGTDNGGGG